MERNFRCRFGEIDIIVKDIKAKEIVFIEVKTRKNYKYGRPAESIRETKKRHIRKVVEYFIYKNKLQNNYIRLDVIEITYKTEENYLINHIKQAF